MTILNVTEARANLYSLIDETAATHQPVIITGKRNNAVLISEEDWTARIRSESTFSTGSSIRSTSKNES